jgi:putative ABC transport system ATP-binding protein
VAETEAFVICEGLARSYATGGGIVAALPPFDARIARGELCAIVGPSGSGKSTLLRLLAGLESPSAGRACVGDLALAELPPGALRRYRRDVVTYSAQGQAENVIAHLTVRDQAGGSADTARLLEQFGVADRRDCRPSALSGGELARASLAIALARPAPLLLSDEPTAELDRAAAAMLVGALLHARDSGRTILVATHDDDLIAAADRVLELGRQAPALPHHAPTGGLQITRDRPIVLTVRDVGKRYGAVRPLNDVSLTLRHGELGVLLGRSGSGKSTLLMIISGFERPDSGGCVLRPDPQRWDQLALLPQRFGLIPELSLEENIAMPARARGDLEPSRPRLEHLLDTLDLSHVRDHPPAASSIGQQQRTALARAAILQPQVLLADEPTSHQDARARERVWSVFRELAAAGTACLVATHDERAIAEATQVWQLSDGTVDERQLAAG